MTTLRLSLVLALAAGATLTAQHAHSPLAGRGEQAMGFDQHATTHHFYLHDDGGAIEVTVNDASDAANLTAIRSHLPHIARMFSAGDFSTPHFVHADEVPGSAAMTQLKDRITYVYEEMPRGGRVRLTTRAAPALAAIHAFLRYQIADHKTGDPLEVTPKP